MTQPKIPAEAKDPEENLARQRLSVLQLTQVLRSVSAACRHSGADRTSFGDCKRRFQTHGLDGLRDLPAAHKALPVAPPPPVVERVLALSEANPTWGCVRLADQLVLEGVLASARAVQTILIKHGVATRYERLLQLEERMAGEPLALTAEQVRLIERANPCFRERHVESSRPGELLAQDTFNVATFKGLGKLYLQVVVDTFGSFGFAMLHTSRRPETAVLILHNEVLPFYAGRGIKVAAVLTDNGSEFCGADTHPFELYLALNDIEHRRSELGRRQSNGFVERLQRTVLDEFFRASWRAAVFDCLDAHQASLDAWLVRYNHEWPHRGYRNMGRRPIETIDQAPATEGQAGL